MYSKDRVLGLIHGLGVYSSRLSIENSAGEEVMQVIRKSSSSFGFLAQGGEIAKIEKNGFTETYKVSMMQGLDVQTKALILSCSYLLVSFSNYAFMMQLQMQNQFNVCCRNIVL